MKIEKRVAFLQKQVKLLSKGGGVLGFIASGLRAFQIIVSRSAGMLGNRWTRSGERGLEDERGSGKRKGDQRLGIGD